MSNTLDDNTEFLREFEKIQSFLKYNPLHFVGLGNTKDLQPYQIEELNCIELKNKKADDLEIS